MTKELEVKKMNWLKLGAAIVCGVMEVVKCMKDNVTVDQVVDRAIDYLREAKTERAAAERREDEVFETGGQ